jgi:hypothetical protein
MITAPPVMGGKISGGWVNFTLTIDPAKWVRIQLTLTPVTGMRNKALADAPVFGLSRHKV